MHLGWWNLLVVLMGGGLLLMVVVVVMLEARARAAATQHSRRWRHARTASLAGCNERPMARSWSCGRRWGLTQEQLRAPIQHGVEMTRRDVHCG
jgi:hypothetical protein